MTNSNDNDNEETVTMGEHVRETHKNKLAEAKQAVGQVVTGDAVGGEVRKDGSQGDDTES